MTALTVTTKRCTNCGELKPLTEFHRHSGRRDGHQSRCKTCQISLGRPSVDAYNAATAALRQAHPDEFAVLLAAERAKRGLD